MWTVGQIVRERREALGLTLAAVAEKIGATKAYISMIENHRVANPPSRHLLEELERALRIGDGALLHAADWENTPAPFRAEFEQITEHRRQIEEFLQLAPHDVLKKWLYIASLHEDFETTMERVAAAIVQDDQRFGIHPHPRKERVGSRSRRQKP